MSIRRLLTAAAMFAAMAGTAAAAQIDELQGAWVQTTFDCDRTFVKKGKTVAFRNKGDMLNTGLIIRGSRVEGPYATCTAERIKRDKENLTVLMSCSSHIMSGRVATSFRIIDRDHFEHFENAFPEIAIGYQRCEP